MAEIGLVGNPNSGKTTLFNALTGSSAYVGNWAGVTVEKKEGTIIDTDLKVVDLPGIYSLSPYTSEEKVSYHYILEGHPDGIINIIDGTNIERNLYLTVQLIEIGIPMVLAVNMMDDVLADGGNIDTIYLSKLLNIPVIPISARRNDNIDKVITAIKTEIDKKSIPPEINYDSKTQNSLNEIYAIIARDTKENVPYPHFAAKILEGNKSALRKLQLNDEDKNKIEEIVLKYEKTSEYGDREAMLADARYKFIEDIIRKCVIKSKKSQQLTISDKIDVIVTNRWLAIPIFLLVMLGMFSLVFGPVGSYLSDIIDYLFSDIITPVVKNILDRTDSPQWVYGLMIDAIINGVGGILTFLPQIALLFLCLSFLEDSGYMARAAFITDRFLRKIGLSGKSFIPMLMGFGCSTPAVMATRSTQNINERRLTILLVPFMSCGAKLPIYALFTGIFFTAHQGLVIFSIYMLGFILAIFIGYILHKTIFKGNMAPFIMELPTYRLPMPKALAKSTWEKCWDFIVKAGTIIFAMSVVIWVLQNFTPSFSMTGDSTKSIFGIFGKLIAPIFIPLGFGTWQASVSLLSGLVAKEAVVSSMLVLYSAANEEALSSILTNVYSPISAFSFLVFVLLYVPCISAFVTIKREMGSLKWALGSALMQTTVAYIVSLLVYQIGSLIF